MWGKRQKLYVRLSRRRALGLLAEMMARAEEDHVDGEPEAVPYPVGNPAPAVPPAREGLLAADVPVDNSAGPEPVSADENPSTQQRHLPAQRTGTARTTVRSVERIISLRARICSNPSATGP
jgi:hypothetical protein